MKPVGIRIFISIFFVLALIPLKINAEEYIEAQIKKYSNNVGFVKSYQREKLKQQFPMCDEFLDVHWFEKRPGKLQRGWRQYTSYDYKYDVYQDKYTELDKPVTVYELVEIQTDGDAQYYGLYFIRRAFPETWKQVIRDMAISGNVFQYQSKKYDVSKSHLSIGKQYLNVCVARPNDHMALFYEMKTVNRVLSDGEQKALIKRINNSEIKFGKNVVENYVPEDINNDGEIDLINYRMPHSLYSSNGKYQKSKRERVWVDEHYELIYTYLPNNKCTLLNTGGYYMLDGKNLLYKSNNTICNLAQLTTKKNEIRR